MQSVPVRGDLSAVALVEVILAATRGAVFFLLGGLARHAPILQRRVWGRRLGRLRAGSSRRRSMATVVAAVSGAGVAAHVV